MPTPHRTPDPKTRIAIIEIEIDISRWSLSSRDNVRDAHSWLPTPPRNQRRFVAAGAGSVEPCRFARTMAPPMWWLSGGPTARVSASMGSRGGRHARARSSAQQTSGRRSRARVESVDDACVRSRRAMTICILVRPYNIWSIDDENFENIVRIGRSHRNVRG